MDGFEVYSHALAALAGYALLMVVLGALSTVGRSSDNRTESGHIKRNYSDPVYRRGRAFMNAIETAGPFSMALMAAILTGSNPFWVNLFASVFLLSRIAMAIVHIRTEIQSLRSAFWAIGTICVAALCVIGVIGAFS